ncbi:hypothetical protein M8542_33905 [Amycolatopsis sp. OK19-0408]|uniref:Hydrolytic protein n=1 Tax=Amycolatopsis iheyensis TaxID=2945988 RepID=A0A9X2NID4_9PSEU|nr:hypothetical protein [Amycolatopsis iheyensis]MCR6487833.1 hypothetical protein [Amycolatopsis iheyensis]
MPSTVSFTGDELSVAPGETVTCEVTVTNTGQLVDRFTFAVVGAPAVWSAVEPEAANLMPGTSATITLTFSPPRAPEAVSGAHHFGVRAESREDPEGSTVEEGTLTIEPFSRIVSELVPIKRRARRKAKYRLAVDNLGNTDTVVEVFAEDPAGDLVLHADPAFARTAPGTATFFTVKALPRKRFLRGQPRILPFRVFTKAADEDPRAEDAILEQEQLVPKWLLPALVALVALLGAAIAFWFAVLKPAVVSVATEQARQQVDRAEGAAVRAADSAKVANAAAQEANGGTGAGKPPANPAGATASRPPATTPAAGADPLSFRLQAEANPVTDGSFKEFTYQVPDGKVLDIGDLVLQNPRGDTGIMRIVLGRDVVLETGLANFRDLDYHYLDPLRATAGAPVVVSVSCTTPGAGATQCTPSVSFSGKLG